MSGRIAADGDTLLVAGYGGAAFYDQNGWHEIVLIDKMEEQYQTDSYRYINKKEFQKRGIEMFADTFEEDVDVLGGGGAYLYREYEECFLIAGNLIMIGD